MGKDIHTAEVNQFFKAVLTLKTIDECYAFFEDVCTINELLSISQRLEVAHMLTDINYLKTGVARRMDEQ